MGPNSNQVPNWVGKNMVDPQYGINQPPMNGGMMDPSQRYPMQQPQMMNNFPYNRENSVNQQNNPFRSNLANNQNVVNQPSGFYGRIIESENEIVRPNEVPMDGNISLFVVKDLETIILKAWSPEGKINTFKYILDPNQGQVIEPEENDFKSEVLLRLEKLEKRYSGNAAKASKKKEDGNE